VTSDCNLVPDALVVPDAPRLVASASGGFGMSFFELACFRPDLGFTKPVRENAFVIALQLRRCPDFDLYADGRLIRPKQFEAGAVAIFDLRTTPATDLRDPFHAIDLYLPVEVVVSRWSADRRSRRALVVVQ
jgi:AraC family transcriptional regulator